MYMYLMCVPMLSYNTLSVYIIYVHFRYMPHYSSSATIEVKASVNVYTIINIKISNGDKIKSYMYGVAYS